MTEGSARSAILERQSTFWCVAFLIALLFAAGNLPWTLDDYDQAKQAFTSYEMVTQGHWFYQHTPKSRVATKPPLVGWISAGIYAVTRSWDVAWRLPSFAAALVLAGLVTRAARDAYGFTAGTIALSAFGLNLLSPRLASLVRTDMPLALVTALLGLMIWHKLRSGAAWNARDRLVMFALLTAAMLIKGPIICVFLLPGIALYEWWRRGGTSSASAWSGSWPWLVSLVIFAAWVVGGIATVPRFYEEVVLREFLGRFDETVHQSKSFLFYLPQLLHRFAPWSVLGIAVAILAARGKKLRERVRELSPEMAWLLCWSLGGLLAMSLIPSKRVDRIFPLVPPLCLAIAGAVSSLLCNETYRPRVLRWSGFALLLACLGISGVVTERVAASYRRGDTGLVDFGAAVRREAAAHHWRYEAIGWREEGLLLYLRKDRFLKPHEAVALWNTGALDALVAPADNSAQLLPQLPGASISPLDGAITVDNRARRYLLLTRSSL